MRVLPITLVGVTVLGIAAIVAKTKQSAAATTTKPQTTPTSKPPTSSTVSTPTITIGPATIEEPATMPTITIGPATVDVPSTIVNQILATGDADSGRNQAVWLNSNGYPKTATALDQYLQGDIDATELRRIAALEGGA